VASFSGSSLGQASMQIMIISLPLIFATVAAKVTAVGCQLIYRSSGNGSLQPRWGDAGWAGVVVCLPGFEHPTSSSHNVLALSTFDGAPMGGGTDNIAA